ncbi:MAG: hypothetical protein WCV67_11460 [Victivallaceae bacterium]|jgi:predicted exporter
MILDLRRYRKVIIVILFAIVGICLLLLSGKKYSSDITDMLPEGSVAAKMLKYLHEENVAGRITVELRLKDNCNNLKLLPQTVTQLEETLKHPEIVSIFTGFAMPDAETLAETYTALPQLINKEDMDRVAEMTSMDEIDKSMRGNYIRLASPGGAALYSFIEKDPLGLNRIVLKKLGLFSDIVSYRTAPGSTMLIGPDQRRALLIIETAIPVSDGRRAAGFLAFLDGAFKKLPEQITASVLCGHKHTIGNEKVIAADIPKVSIASLIIFALLFAVIYRKRPQSFLIVLMPMVAVLITVAVMGLMIDRISAFVIGFGGVMAGISVDYGICVYELCGRTAGNRLHEVSKIVRPLCAGALTTIGIFVAFLFSGTGAYTQLGIFAILSVSLSLAMAVYILPNLLPDNVKSSIIQLNTPVFKYRSSLFIVIVWGIVIAASTALALSFSFFDSSVTSLDGAGKDVINAEAEFNAYWSKREMPAILAVKGKDREQVLQTGESLAAIADESGIKGFVSPVMLTPSARTAQHNQSVWREFWTVDKINKTQDQIVSSGSKSGFREDAFNAFNAWLAASRDSGSKCALLATIQDKLLKRNGEEWTLTSFMIDSPENYKLLEKVQKQLPGLRVISPRVLRSSIGEEEINRLLGIGIASFVIVLLLSIFATGGFVTGAAALLPVVAAVTVICGFSAALNLPLTIPSCVAMIIIIGLSSDYGIFMVFRCFKSLENDIMTAVTLCALATAAGALTLLFASHPVMFKLGITLFAGIVISYAAAVTLLPALAGLIKGKPKTGIQLLMLFVALAGCAGCSSLPEPGPLLSSPVPQAYNPPDKQWSTVSSLTFSVSGHMQDSLLCAAEFDAVSRGGSIVCMQPAGIKILETSFRGDKITHRFVIPELEKRGLKVDDVVRDLQRISFDTRAADLPGIAYEFDNNTGMLSTKKFIKNGRCIWTISYRQYKLSGGYSVPFEIRLDSSEPEYSLLIRIKEFSEIPLKRVQ